jgi:hypothetical protein
MEESGVITIPHGSEVRLTAESVSIQQRDGSWVRYTPKPPPCVLVDWSRNHQGPNAAGRLVTVVYHGTPITPNSVLMSVAGRAFCITYYYRDRLNVPLMEDLATELMVDWGAFPAWKQGIVLDAEYRRGYFEWVDPLLDRPTTWAVIPDNIGAGTQELDALIREWPHGRERGAPVYHLDAQMMQPAERMLRLLDEFPRVCIGWAEKDLPILGDDHQRCLDDLWNEIDKRHRRTPVIHHFRGTQLVHHRWPFASLDSTDVARNHNRAQNTAEGMANRWDGRQCPARWTPIHYPQQPELC